MRKLAVSHRISKGRLFQRERERERERAVVLRRFNSQGHQRPDAVDKSLGVGSLRLSPGPRLFQSVGDDLVEY